MPAHSITLTIEGTEANERHLDLSVLAEKFRQFNQLLISSVQDNKRQHYSVRVINLSHSSPANLTCQITHNGAPDIASMENVGKMLANNMKEASDDFLYFLKKLSDINPKKIAHAKIVIHKGDGDKEKYVCNLSAEFTGKINSVVRDEHPEINTTQGFLEEINIHNKTFSFKIYDAGAFGVTISCRFPQALLEQVKRALGKGVFVTGEFYYKGGEAFPDRIDATEIEILPPENTLPSFKDLRGIAPDLAEGESSENYVREERGKWHKDW